MVFRPLWSLMLLALCVGSSATKVNPVRRVLSMLQMMQKKVTEEGEVEQGLFDSYMCYCQSSGQTLAKSVTDAGDKIPQLQSEIEAGTAEQAQLTSDVAQATKDKEATEKSIAESTSLRKKEADIFTKETTADQANIASMITAIKALRKGLGESFLQTSDAGVLRQLAVSTDLPEWDRHTLSAFLMSGQSDQDQDNLNVPDSSEIVGIVSQMQETLEKNVAEATEAERKAINDYNALVGSKKKEAEVITKDLESKRARLGAVRLELTTLAQNLKDTSKTLEEDRKFLKDLTHGCDLKQDEWHERTMTRSQEQAAISDTIAILNDDETTNLFKSSLPSFMQVQMTKKDVVDKARKALQGAKDPRVKLIAMAMHAHKGKGNNFDKVIGMMDKMIALLGKEQEDDEEENAYCKKEIDSAEDKKMTLADSISDDKKTIANAKELMSTLKDEVTKVTDGITALDKAAATATRERKAQNVVFQEEMTSNGAAIEILNVAKTRLEEFYGKPKSKLLQRSSRHLAKTAAATATAGADTGNNVADAFAFLQESSAQDSSQLAPPPKPPSTWGQKKTKSDSSGIFSMLDTIIGDLTKEVAEAQKEERDSQDEYELFMKESSAKHASDAKIISAKESAKAEAEANLQERGHQIKMTTGEAAANAKYLEGLHQKCDWLMKHMKVRKEARTTEIASLKQAKAVLGGTMPSSFLQAQDQAKHNLRKR